MMSERGSWADPAAEEQLRGAVSLDEPWRYIERCSELTRFSGSGDERVAFDHLAERLGAWGVQHTLHLPEVFISWPVAARVTLEAPGEPVRTFAAKTPAMSVSTGGEVVTGPAAHLPSRYARGADDLFASGLSEISGGEVAGRVVVTEGLPMPAKVADLQRLGAVAAVFISPGERIHEGICTTIWGSPDLDTDERQPTIPVAEVIRPDGEALLAAVAAGEARLGVATELDTRWRPIPVLVAEIPGTEEPERFVLLHGHVDSWHVGIGDNATGNATLLELARLFAQEGHRPRRSLRIAWWSGHSHGRYAGSTWYADTFALELAEGCAAQLNCDSPGCRWASTFNDLETTEETWPLAEAAIQDASGIAAEWGRPARAGDYSFMNLGISAAFMLSSTMPDDLRAKKGYYAVGGCGGNIAWHTEDDTLEIADRDNLLRDIRVYATAASRLLNAPVLPLDFRRTAAGIAETLATYQSAAGERFRFDAARAALAELDMALGQLADAAVEAAGGDDADRLARVNGTLVGLSRLLVPINYARDGRFRQDPAADVPPLPDLAPALTLPDLTPGSHRDHLTRLSLLRGQNRLVWALRQATEVAAAAAM